jgi:hypothetical protein
MTRPLYGLLIAVLACSAVGASAPVAPRATASAIARAQVWRPTTIPAMNIRLGPTGSGAFAPGATVNCDYLDKKLSGNSPKFACAITPGDELKVNFGANNGEVYGEVASTRLLWALGFGADAMYPARVICRGCPEQFGGIVREGGERVITPAAIERKMPGTELLRDGREGWAWTELDMVDEAAGGAPKAHRDALTLLAVLLQHTDTKPEQQRLVCLEPRSEGEHVDDCESPFLFIQDLGLTFGRANAFNANYTGSVNFSEWSQTPVWKDATGCVGNLPKSLTGTLDDPTISESGRQFLADLLVQLSDRQLYDLFDVARVTIRPRVPSDVRSGTPTIDEWVQAFKQKRDEIVNRRCT